jgi:hypothetical protein
MYLKSYGMKYTKHSLLIISNKHTHVSEQLINCNSLNMWHLLYSSGKKGAFLFKKKYSVSGLTKVNIYSINITFICFLLILRYNVD